MPCERFFVFGSKYVFKSKKETLLDLDLQRQVLSHLKKLEEKFKKENPEVKMSEYKVVFNMKAMTINGAYYFNHNTYGECIRLHMELLRLYGTEYIERTVSHEFAHYATAKKYGFIANPHGKKYKKVGKELGLGKKVLSPTYRYKKRNKNILKNRDTAYYKYKCSCKAWFFDKRTHNKMRKSRKDGMGDYGCQRCGSRLVFIKTILPKK